MQGRRISVALCTYNGAPFLEAQLASIAAQTVPVDEVVVGDDGSQDDTTAILERAHGMLPQLRLLPSAERVGVTANFERTIAASDGDIILLSDQDDVWHPDRVQTTLQAFSDNTAIDLVHSDARLIDGHGLVLSGTLLDRLRVGGEARAALAGGASFAPLMRRNLVTGATVAIRSSLLERALPFPTSWLHDEWLAAIAASSRGTRLIDRALIDYRLHEDNEVGAERITAAVRLSRLTSDRSARNARLLARARDLAERLPDGSSKNIAQAKLQHETVRSGYPAGRLRRAPAVVRELATGRYSRFGRGVEDVVRDLVQPARSDR